MKLIHHILSFVRGNKRKKPLANWFKLPPVFQRKKEVTVFSDDYIFRKAIRKEREIGVHPKYRNRQSKYSKLQVLNWEKLSREWDEANV